MISMSKAKGIQQMRRQRKSVAEIARRRRWLGLPRLAGAYFAASRTTALTGARPCAAAVLARGGHDSGTPSRSRRKAGGGTWNTAARAAYKYA